MTLLFQFALLVSSRFILFTLFIVQGLTLMLYDILLRTPIRYTMVQKLMRDVLVIISHYCLFYFCYSASRIRVGGEVVAREFVDWHGSE